MITGASDGLGRALAETLAAQGHQLIVHGRDERRLAEVAAATGGYAVPADLSSLAAVRRLATQVSERYDRLDVLVNNAAVGFGAAGEPRQLSTDGHELRLAVDYLAPYLLTRLLLPLLRPAPSEDGTGRPARIVNVASIGQHDVDLDDLMLDRGYDRFVAYRRAKLALIADTFGLAEELAGHGVTVNALHPATLMPTTMVRTAGMDQVESLETGLRATLRLVVDPTLADVTGQYFDRDRVGRALDQAYDPGFRARLRAVTERLVTA